MKNVIDLDLDSFSSLQPVREQLRIWGEKHYQTLRRPIAEDYDVSNAVLEHLSIDIAKALEGVDAYVLTQGTPEYQKTDWDECASPHVHDFRVLDVVLEVIKRFPHPPCVLLEPSRLMVVRYPGVTFSAVLVHISAPGTRLYVIVAPTQSVTFPSAPEC